MRKRAKLRNSGKAIRKRSPAAVSGGTLSTAILIPSHVVPQLRQTIKNSVLVSNPASQGLLIFIGVLTVVDMWCAPNGGIDLVAETVYF
ncbi:hypothetical protein RCC30_08860 [Pseudomonas fluorescens]|nr:hypothetical protein RCC30_08860 [Pseudomonas fluorescens]